MNKEYESAKREFETWNGINDILASKAKKKMDLLEKKMVKEPLDNIVEKETKVLVKPKKKIVKKRKSRKSGYLK